jgi:hypothetical protein
VVHNLEDDISAIAKPPDMDNMKGIKKLSISGQFSISKGPELNIPKNNINILAV